MTVPLHSRWRRPAEGPVVRQPPFYLRVLRWWRRSRLGKQTYAGLLRCGDVVFDVGANRGGHTLRFSHLVGPHGEVHAFEPLPPTFARLRRAVERQRRFENIFLNNAACAEHACELALQVPGEGPGQAGLAPRPAGPGEGADAVTLLPVCAIRLDNYSRGRAGRRLDLVKCDVQGAELPVLRGLRQKLGRHHPLLVLETFAAFTGPFGYAPAELVAFLQSVGYDTFYLGADRRVPVCDPQTTLAAAATEVTVKFLCACAEPHRERLARAE